MPEESTVYHLFMSVPKELEPKVRGLFDRIVDQIDSSIIKKGGEKVEGKLIMCVSPEEIERIISIGVKNSTASLLGEVDARIVGTDILVPSMGIIIEESKK